MSQIVVITFDDPDQAGKVRESLRKLEKNGQLRLDDAVVLVKDENGEMKIKDEVDRSVKTGAVGGGLLGMLIGGVIFPFAGLLFGAAAGALLGKSFSDGVDKQFVQEVIDAMRPGTSAIFAVVRDSNREVAIATLRQYQGEVYHTSLDSETEAALRQALEK